jgi:hypothetical protein
MFLNQNHSFYESQPTGEKVFSLTKDGLVGATTGTIAISVWKC